MTRLGRWRLVLSPIIVFPLVFIAVLALGGWYLSDELKRRALTPGENPRQHDLEVVHIQEGQVTLRLTRLAEGDGTWKRAGIWGMEWDGGYARVGAILDLTDHQVIREFYALSELPGAGEMVHLDNLAYAGDPKKALNIPFQDVSFSSPLGDLAAWFVGGSSETWAIFVHGRNASPHEGLRILPTLVELGLPCLLITYRNDDGAPVNRDGFHRHGQTEWKDLEGAADYALDHGARDLLLIGYSMGGAIVMNFLYESSLKEKTLGVVLDSPMLDFSATVDHAASQLGPIRFLTPIGKFIARFRFDINWRDWDYLAHADRLAIPVLLFHGDEDYIVPIKTSDTLSRIRPDIVKYVRGAGVTHVASWNNDPAGYEGAVRDFILALPK